MSSREFMPPIQSWEAELEGKLQKRVRYDRSNIREPIRPAAALGDRVRATVQVAGMTCRSCEVRIQRHVGGIPNVLRVTASSLRGQVEIESSAPIPPGSIALAVEAAGYKVGRTRWVERDPIVWLTAIGGILMVAAFAVVAQRLGLGGLASGAGSLSSGGLAVALLLGLAAGVSTCMALVGGLVLAMSAAFQKSQAALARSAGVGAQMRPALVFMSGRIVGYGVLGAALGAVGASVTMPPRVTAILMIAVAVVMIILGTRLTGLSPRIATWSPTLPMGLGSRLGLSGGSAGGYSDRRAAGLGAASFFLPCGFTQAVQIYALSTGSPLFAGALMATFAIGTAPGLLAMAGLPIVVPGRMRPTLLRLVGVVVLGFAVLNGGAGFRLAGISLPGSGAKPVAIAVPTATKSPASDLVATGPAATDLATEEATAAAPTPDQAQRLTTYQNVDGYTPEEVTIYAGVPTHWTIKSTSNESCTIAVVVPDLNLQVNLELGDNTVELPALSVGKLDYSCAMGMVGGRINVVARPNDPAD
jgi:sulfite exporter TauE/SafE/copper chaperone CopZ